MAGRERKFGGKIYEHLAFSFRKKEAESDADKYRRNWGSVRITKSSQGYDLWGRSYKRERSRT
jgi:hypothetical protein